MDEKGIVANSEYGLRSAGGLVDCNDKLFVYPLLLCLSKNAQINSTLNQMLVKRLAFYVSQCSADGRTLYRLHLYFLHYDMCGFHHVFRRKVACSPHNCSQWSGFAYSPRVGKETRNTILLLVVPEKPIMRPYSCGPEASYLGASGILSSFLSLLS